MAQCNVDSDTLEQILALGKAWHDKTDPLVSIGRWLKGVFVTCGLLIFALAYGWFELKSFYRNTDENTTAIKGLTSEIQKMNVAAARDEEQKKSTLDRIERLERKLGL